MYDELSSSAREMETAIAELGFLGRLVWRRRQRRLAHELDKVRAHLARYDGRTLGAPQTSSAICREWRFARPPAKLAACSGFYAALAYELAGRVFESAANLQEAKVTLYVAEVEPATGHTYQRRVLAARFDRSTYEVQVHARVDPAAAIGQLFSCRSQTDARAMDDRESV